MNETSVPRIPPPWANRDDVLYAAPLHFRVHPGDTVDGSTLRIGADDRWGRVFQPTRWELATFDHADYLLITEWRLVQS